MNILLKLILSILIGVALGALVTAPWRIKNDKVVENYCAVIHQYNVKDYKACKVKSKDEILKDLIKRHNENKELVNLEVIK